MADEAPSDSGLRKFLRRPDVEAATGLPTATLYAMMAKGAFPRPINITPGRVAWLETDVIAWQEARLADHAKARV
jgi:prophage regulatory protein